MKNILSTMGRRWVVIPFLVVALLMGMAGRAQAVDTGHDGVVAAGETVNDDVLLFGPEVRMDGTVNGTLIGLLQPWLSRRAAAFDAGRVLALAALLVALGYGGYAFAASAWAWGGATAVWTLGEILLFPSLAALVAALSPADLRGRYQGALSTVFGLGLAAAPPLGGLVLDRLGATPLWLGCAATCLLVALGHLLAAGPRRRAIAAGLRSAAADGASGPPGV